MILPFKTKFADSTPTNFIAKIWSGIRENIPYFFHAQIYNYEERYCDKFGLLWDGWGDKLIPKIHTIREDAKERWKPGNKIHMVVFNRSKNQFQFAPVLECKSVQKIEILRAQIENMDYIQVNVDDKELAQSEISELAINDGFS